MKHVFVGFFTILTLFSCNNDDVNNEPPLLSVPPVALSEVHSTIAFGEALSASKKSPAIEYITNSNNVNVRSASLGKVEKIIMNDGVLDYEIHIRPISGSEWLIIYDHVLDVTISKGDNVQQGAILGKVGVGNRTELQVNKGNGGDAISYCPLNYGTKAFIDEHLAFMDNWCLKETIVP